MNSIPSKAGTSKHDEVETLRERLRQGDPALGAELLQAEEVQEMRRALLRAIPELHPRAAWLTPLRAGAAIAALVGLVLALFLWKSPENVEQAPRMANRAEDPGPSPVAPSQRVAASAPPAASSTLPAAAERRSRQRHPSVPRSRPSAPPERIAAQPPVPESQDATPSVASTTQPASTRREMHFSSPGGTRIVWVFASGDAPASETPLPSRL